MRTDGSFKVICSAAHFKNFFGQICKYMHTRGIISYNMYKYPILHSNEYGTLLRKAQNAETVWSAATERKAVPDISHCTYVKPVATGLPSAHQDALRCTIPRKHTATRIPRYLLNLLITSCIYKHKALAMADMPHKYYHYRLTALIS